MRRLPSFPSKTPVENWFFVFMKKTRTLELIKTLTQKPSFTIEEASQAGVSRRMLSYYAKTGVLVRLGAGVYCGLEELPGADLPWDDLIRTLSQVPSGVVCLTTALRLWDLTDEHAREFWVALPPTQWPPRLKHLRAVRMRNLGLGKTTVQIGPWQVPLFDKERTVVDSFRFLGPEIAIKALKRLYARDDKNFQNLILYAKALRVNIAPYLLTVST